MNKEEKLKLLSERIRELCPELNCKRCESRGWTDYGKPNGKLECACCDGRGWEGFITLEHVLKASQILNREIGIDESGGFLEYSGGSDTGWQTYGCDGCNKWSEWCECEPTFEPRWILGLPLSQQSGETVNFLYLWMQTLR